MSKPQTKPYAVHRENQMFFDGETSRPVLVDREKVGSEVIIMGLYFFVLQIPVCLFAFFQPIVGAVLFLATLFIPIAYFVQARRDQQLVSNGILLDGEITRANLIRRTQRYILTPPPPMTWLKIRYQFVTPDGQTLLGQVTARRDDLAYLEAPPIGTPIKVLYLNTRLHKPV